ncbi:MAG: bifunctional oligoribonuclease/PAP phosphatase NrnA [Ruminococcaceae bacterium]|nr:bifunctional oligoribonuclease/PAP phosphatase NrnA [Oscillospiraceae bacterium]
MNIEKNIEKKRAILDKIKEYDRIMLFRHKRNDGDCVGSTKGLKEIIRCTFPEKEVYIIDDDHSDYLDFLGAEDEAVSDEIYSDALAIVIDTATENRISNQKYTLCREVVKIDHHIENDNTQYGDYVWVEEERSSACEMIAEFYMTFQDELKINSDAAKYIYTGMVTDSGRFRFRSVTGDTLRCAAAMLDCGIDTDDLFSHLYLTDYESLKFRSYVYDKMKITEGGVAYVYITLAAQKKFGLTFEEACTCISLMDSIKGCLCWIAFIEEETEEGKSIRVRLRSRLMHVNGIAEKYRGGGHDCASGATVFNRREVNALVADADALIKEYKRTHEDWL